MSKEKRRIFFIKDQTVGAVHTFPISKTSYRRMPDGSLRRVETALPRPPAESTEKQSNP